MVRRCRLNIMVRDKEADSICVLGFGMGTDEDFYRNDYPEEEAFDSEDSYGDGVGSADERGDW